MLYDISPPLDARLQVWPGDTPFTRHVTSDIAHGDRTTGSELTLTAHCGAHADAPAHYTPGGRDVATCDLHDYLGPCEVVRVNVPRGGVIEPHHLPAALRAPRVLFATGTFPDSATFNTDFAALTVATIDRLRAMGVRLVGIDTPSVDRFTDNDLPVHARIADHDLRILEGLRLADVPAGLFELIALPLRIVGGDGSPVRAVLRTLPHG